jgi:Cu/Ag efflux protein CusF
MALNARAFEQHPERTVITRRAWLAGATLMVGFAASCARSEHAYDYGTAKQRYQLHGKILRMQPENRIAVIEHEKVEGWMEAMTMGFPVPSLAEYSKLKEGMVIRATVNVNESYFWLTDVVIEKP